MKKNQWFEIPESGDSKLTTSERERLISEMKAVNRWFEIPSMTDEQLIEFSKRQHRKSSEKTWFDKDQPSPVAETETKKPRQIWFEIPNEPDTRIEETAQSHVHKHERINEVLTDDEYFKGLARAYAEGRYA